MLSSGSRCQSNWIGTAALVAVLAAGVPCVAFAADNSSTTVAVGELVTYRDVAGRDWCATVVALVDGPGDGVWAWLRFITDPRRTDHAPVSELKAGCAH